MKQTPSGNRIGPRAVRADGPPRKYYQLTADGQTALEELDAYWQRINRTIRQLGK